MSNSSRGVFLSYASQDTEAAKRLCTALREKGVEVWFDQSELVGGDAWDQKIRKQIRECALLIPIISQNTQARTEGYFRLEWRLAEQRTHLMAKGRPFLLPVVIDDTHDSDAQVPDSFTEVQWTRMPGGEASPAFCERVKKLLDWKPMAERDHSVPTSPPERREARGEPVGPVVRSMKNRRLAPAIAGAVMVLLALVFWRPWEKSRQATEKSTDASKTVAVISEARQLAARARELGSLDGISRERLGAADDLVKQAFKLDPTEAEVWATAAQIDTFMFSRGFDIAESRRQSAVSGAARALTLAPNSFEARHAQAVVAGFLIGSKEMLAEAEADYRALLRERPDDPELEEEYGGVFRGEGRFAEAAAAFARAGRPLQAGWAHFDGGKWAEAKKIADVELAKGRTAGALILKANVELFGYGDREAAAAALNQLSPTELMGEDALAIALRLAMVQRDADRITRLLNAFPGPFITILNVSYPRQYWTGMALEMQSQSDAARAEWRRGLETIDERLKFNPHDWETIGWKATFLSLLGEKDATEQALRLYRSYRTVPPEEWDWWAGLSILHEGGRNDEVLAMLAGSLRKRDDWARILHLFVRYAAEFDPLRSDPRFEQLLRETLPEGMKPFDDAKPVVDEKSVAVLAFANLSDDKGNEYFSDGISEELLNVLAKVPGLKVSARTSAFSFKGKDVPVPEIGRQLGVAYVVEGSVRKQGDRVRITAQLIKAADGFHVWSDNFDRDLKDVFAVQDEIAALIAKNLALKLGAAERAHREVNPEAHRLVLEARHFWNLRTTDGFARAEAADRQAIALDPDFAPARAGLATVLQTRWIYRAYEGIIDPSDLTSAQSEIERALALDPDLIESYPTLGFLATLEGRSEESERIFARGIALNPNFALNHHWLALVFEIEGRLDNALREIERAIELDPLSGVAISTRGRMLFEAGRYEEALAAYTRSLPLWSQRPTLVGSIAGCQLKLHRTDEAVEGARRALQMNMNEVRLTVDGEALYVLRQAGREAEAAELSVPALARLGADSYQRGAVLAALGRWDEAEPFLERTPLVMRYLFFWHPMWDTERDNPRFARLMEKLNCAKEYRVARETLARMQKAATP